MRTSHKPKEVAAKAAETRRQQPTTKDPSAPRAAGTAAEPAEPAAAEARTRMSPRGVAPWTSRHAARRASAAKEVAAAGAPPPGSARATLRAPAESDALKVRILRLHHLTTSITSACKKLEATFYEVAKMLQEIEVSRLFEAKGYRSLEAFAERELPIGRHRAPLLAKAAELVSAEQAAQLGLEATLAVAAGDAPPPAPRTVQAASPEVPRPPRTQAAPAKTPAAKRAPTAPAAPPAPSKGKGPTVHAARSSAKPARPGLAAARPLPPKRSGARTARAR